VARTLQSRQELLAIERFTVAIALDHHERHLLHPLVRGETPATCLALTPAPDGVFGVWNTRFHDTVL
jgi:hypothetical protein